MRLVVYRLIEIKELADYRAIADVFGYGAESVILGNTADVVLAIILAECFIVPRDTLLYISTVQSRWGCVVIKFLRRSLFFSALRFWYFSCD